MNEDGVSKKGCLYPLPDEIQRVKGWEMKVNALIVDTETDAYLTGLNAHLPSTDLPPI